MLRQFLDRHKNSLRAKLLLWLVPPVLAVIIVSSLVCYTLAVKFATEAYDAGLFDSARPLAQQIRVAPDGKISLALPQAATEILEYDPYDKIFFRVLSRNGKTVIGQAALPLPEEPLTRARPLRFYYGTVAGQPIRICAYAVFRGGDRRVATVLFAETLVKRKRLSHAVLLTMLLPVVTLAVVVAVLIGLGVRHSLSPLQRLATALSNRGWSNLTGVGHLGVPDEVRPLTDAIDGLMHRLGAALTAQQRFIAEAAHQLRTPMAGLTSQTERALLANDAMTIKPALDQLLLSARRVNRLVNQLLMLARAEPGNGAEHDFVTLDLSALVQQACMEWVPEALRKSVDLGFAGESSPVLIEGNELLLAEMLNNLIDNALRYGARAGGTITVKLTAEPHVELSVEDDGPGIPEDARPRLFERFHRLPGSAPGGCGLGLAIVREIARAHRGEATVATPESGRGTLFRVIFSQAAKTRPAPSASVAVPVSERNRLQLKR